MRNIATLLLLLFITFSATAQDYPILNGMVSILNSGSVDNMATFLNGEGYKEVSDPVFKQKNLRVFQKKDPKGDEVYILEYCGSTLTGYYTALSRPAHHLLKLDLEKQGYKTANDDFDRYHKNDLNIKVVNDQSVVNSFGQSDVFGKADRYVHLSRVSSCPDKGLYPTYSREFNFHPRSVESCLANLQLKQSDLLVAMARSAYFTGSSDATSGLVKFVKDDKSINVKLCEGRVTSFSALLPKSDGRNLEESLKKKGFAISMDNTSEGSEYLRVYETEEYSAMFKYFGDVTDESNRDHAYQLLFKKKNISCK